ENQFSKWGIPDAVKIEAAEIKAGVPDTDPQTLYVIYESLFDPNPYLADQVKIEVSVRSLKEPKAVVKIQSVLATEFPGSAYPEEPFEVTVVEAHRTFLEKAFLLHEEFLRPDKTKIRIERMSRHLYDLERMMDHDSGKKALANDDLYNSIINHRKNYSSLSWVDYKTLERATISFVLPEELIDLYKKDYSAMTEQMIYGEAITFDQLLARLNELLERFRATAEKAAVKMVKIQPEYPPYEFYRKAEEAKYDTWNVDVDEKYNMFRLHNFTLSPIELHPELSMTITVDDRTEKKEYRFQLGQLHYNPVHKESLFFLAEGQKHVDIPLPKGRKWVTIKIIPTNDSKEFNAKLACEYVK
ncbi:MAG TPA: nucleotidyl transferase AbiEii/AbiGii toxin family protein, partial [Bacteroidia bacterium]|nr:nucleotidyl transferase AbiEii/AbiGii toxin family protein [Bacteroidia bacterium]